MGEQLLPLAQWWAGSSLADWVNSSRYIWPTLETLHFLALCVLMGSLLVVDLRLLGLYRNLAAATAQRCVYWALGAFAANLLTGFCFLAGNMWKYWDNPSFQIKLVLICIAGFNAVFYQLKAEDLIHTGQTTLSMRVIGGLSLLCWCGVIICGRMITFTAY